MKPLEFCSIWHDPIAFPPTLIYGRIISIGKVFAFVLFEHADKPRRIDLHRISEADHECALECWTQNVNKAAALKYFGTGSATGGEAAK